MEDKWTKTEIQAHLNEHAVVLKAQGEVMQNFCTAGGAAYVPERTTVP